MPVIFLVMFIGGILAMYFQPPGLQRFLRATGLSPGGGTDDPIAVPVEIAETLEKQNIELAHTDVVGLGKLLPKGDVVTLALPFGAGDARIDHLEVEIGDAVQPGEIVAVLDNLAQLQSAVDGAEAAVSVQEATLAQTQKSVTSSRAELRAALAQAKTSAEDAHAELERTEKLVRSGVVTDEELDRARSAASRADTEVERARATLSRYRPRTKNESQADVLVALRSLEAARADLERAQRDLTKASVRAPAAGTVLDIHVRPGEKPGAEGVMSIGNIDEMTAEVEVFQTLVGRVSLGDPVEIVSDVLPSRLRGRVERIGLEVGRQSVIDDDPAANTDARVVKVIVALDKASSVTARTYTNLEVVARIRTVEDDE